MDKTTELAMTLARSALEEQADRIAELEEALRSILEITQEEYFLRSHDSRLYEIGTYARLALSKETKK